ncbi:PREDICTED: replication factor A protein 1-like [Ipomoea nil]|uniref:replication factor A protein 1-like n=1 Tax=Ipomoea nil TaxID=35883 RepID=UPI0009010AE2|nr:PREDICTED: replication factor A protein 1-like [Ipomoea nil]
MPSMFILVKDIKPQHQLRAVRVRAVRVFEVPKKRGEGHSSKNMEVLLHDEEGSYIHATIQKKDVVKYREIFKEGKLFEIKNFMAATNYYVYKITQHAYMIKLNYRTEVKEINSLGFPFKMFRLKSFISLKDTADVNDKELIDVIGRVIGIYNPVDKIIGGKVTKLIDFQIEDNAENTLTCTLWNEHVASLMPYYNSDSKEPLIVVIQCCRAKLVSGEVRITSSYDATKLWFNEDFEEFLEFKSNMKSENTHMKSLSTGTLHSQSAGISDFKIVGLIVTTCYDLKKTQVDVEYYVAAEILGLDLDDGWYYVSCMSAGCNKKLKENGGVLSVISHILRVHVEVPPELDAIVGMKMLFKVGLKLALKRGNNSPFNVLRLLRDEHFLQTYSDRFVEHQEQDLISKMLEEETNSPANYEEASIGVEVNSPASVQPSQHELDDTTVNSLTTKRLLLDEFSSSKSRKKATPSNIKKEKTA